MWRWGVVFVIPGMVIACAADSWPEPPAVDAAAYQQAYDAWKAERQETLRSSVKILGIWTLSTPETPFGSDPSLPIVLPERASPPRAGVFRTVADGVEVVPAPGAVLASDGRRLSGPSRVHTVSLGSVTLDLFPTRQDDVERVAVSASDAEHPVLAGLAPVATYPIDPAWRVAARFDAFETPRTLRISDVRGGATEMPAPGELVFRAGGREHRLTAIGFPGEAALFVMFKDETNGGATYGGYRILSPAAADDGAFTVLDFNLAANPPCAYSPYTTCPLPPPGNDLAIAVEAGEQRHPTARGFGAR